MKSHHSFFSLLTFCCLLLLTLTCSHPVQAANMLTNSSFESGSFAANRSDGGMSLATGSTTITGWTTVNGEVNWIPNGNPYGITAQNGTYSLDISGYHDSSPYGGVSQTVTTVAGTSYQLSFYLGVIPSTTGFNGPVAVKVSAGSASKIVNYDTGSATGSATLWQLFTYTFTATSTSTTVSIVGTFDAGGLYLGLDNVSLDVSPLAPLPISNLLFNGSFEHATNFTTSSTGINSLNSGSTALAGWTVVTQELNWVTNGNSFGIVAKDIDGGHFSLDLTGSHDFAPAAGITQTATTITGTPYLLSFYLGTIPARGGFYGPITATVTAGPLSATATNSDGSVAGGSSTTVWRKYSYMFNANSTSTAVNITGGTATGGAYLGLDAVSLVANHLQIEGGYGHAIALGGDGTVFTWGLNTNGQLGLGHNTSTSTPTQVTGLGTPVDGESPWAISTAAGNYHSVAALNDGTVWTWGINTNGQLGNGTTTTSNVPVQVSSFGTGGATPKMVAAGNSHTLAILTDGTVWAWGSNSKGQLGHHSLATQSTTPWQVMISPSTPTYITNGVSISGGVDFAMALTSAGTVYTWGDNSLGQLGLGSGATATKTVATLIPTSTLSGVTAIASGANHGMALKSDGTVWTWGDNTFGQLGNGTTTASPAPVQVSGLTNIVAINAGGYFSLALDSTGHVYAWGSDSNGQLCDGFSGTNHNQTTPQLIPALNPSGGVSAMVLAAGMYFAVIMNTDGSVEGFGQNSYGQLGNGATATSQRSPVTAGYNALSD